jgi:hypothetical protein
MFQMLPQPRLGQHTIAQYRRRKQLRKLLAQFELDLQTIPLSEGRVVFIRWVSARGTIRPLAQRLRVGLCCKFLCESRTRYQAATPHSVCQRHAPRLQALVV